MRPGEMGHMNNKTYGSGQVSQLPVPTPPDVALMRKSMKIIERATATGSDIVGGGKK